MNNDICSRTSELGNDRSTDPGSRSGDDRSQAGQVAEFDNTHGNLTVFKSRLIVDGASVCRNNPARLEIGDEPNRLVSSAVAIPPVLGSQFEPNHRNPGFQSSTFFLQQKTYSPELTWPRCVVCRFVCNASDGTFCRFKDDTCSDFRIATWLTIHNPIRLARQPTPAASAYRLTIHISILLARQPRRPSRRVPFQNC